MTHQLTENHSTLADRWIELRESERVDVDLTGHMDYARVTSDIHASRVRVLNVSAGGAMVEVTGDYPPGVVLVLRIATLGEFEAEKRWSNNDQKIGLKFIDAHPEIYQLVGAFAKSHQEAKPLKLVPQ